MRYVNLDAIPKRKNGNFNWKDSVGCIIKFIYDNIKSEMKIIDVLNEDLIIEYNGEQYKIGQSNLKRCKLNFIVNDIKRSKKFNYDVNDIIIRKKHNLIVIELKYDTNKMVKVKCDKCGNLKWIKESLINSGKGSCEYCSNQKVKVGKNDLFTTHPEIINYLKNKNDSHKYTHGTQSYVQCVCPICGSEKKVSVSNLCSNGFHCGVCSDGISLPNKFIRNILKELNIEFISEYSPYYFKGRYSDVFIPSLNLVIEMDGDYGNHKDVYIDYWKDFIHLQQGVKTIRVDLTENYNRREFECLKENTIKCLGHVLNLNNLNWKSIFEKSSNSILHEVCKFKNDNEVNSQTIANCFGINVCTVIKYLKLGNDLGLCQYDSFNEKKNNSKRVMVIDYTNNREDIYESCTYLEENSEKLYGVKFTHVSEICSRFNDGNRTSLYKKRFKFKYV